MPAAEAVGAVLTGELPGGAIDPQRATQRAQTA
jgi:hypothetical protein